MSLPNLGSVATSFATGIYAVTRSAPDTYDADGKIVVTAPSTVNVTASVHRATGRDLERLPEGMRARETIKVFTTEALYTQDETHKPDVITAVGYDWEVVNVDAWGSLGGGYWRCLCTKVQP